ncbi:MAG: hypothetical protein HYX41_05070 [Bdellovibrio sp.]|nr:hypothetical protein [Bdellovibrio sp.]
MRTLSLLSAFALVLSGCSLVPNTSRPVGLTLHMPFAPQEESLRLGTLADLPGFPTGPVSPPTSLTGFDCYAFNIFGPGINGDLLGAGSNNIPPAGCSYLGISSVLLPPSQTTATLVIPSGPTRTVQAIGIATGNGCPATGSLRDYLGALKSTYGTGPLPVILTELGKTTADIFQDSIVNVQNTFASGTTSTNGFPFHCPAVTTPGTILPLVAGFRGEVINGTFSETFSNNLPPSGLVAISNAEVTTLSNPFNTTPVFVTTPASSYFERLDLVFNTASVNLSAFSTVLVEAMIVGGLSPQLATVCTAPASLTTPGAEIRIYDPVAAAWTPTNSINTTTTFQGVSFVASKVPLQMAVTETGTPAGTYLHVSIRSQQATSGSITCSTVGVKFIRVSLIPSSN